MSMRNPVHPGVIVRRDCIEAEGVSIKAAAESLGVTRQTLNSLVNEKSSLTPEMSLRLEGRGWGKAEVWVRTLK